MGASIVAPYTWQRDQAAALQSLQEQQRLPHALIFSGSKGIGKADFAAWFAANLMCQEAGQEACGVCQNCTLVESDSHPDFRNVTILKDEKTGKVKKEIGIDQIRDLIQFVSLSQAGNGYKVVVISPADALNVSSANSLLKLLEEPQGQTIILLVVDQVERLPATIRSRCQIVNMPLPQHQEAADWLKNQDDFGGDTESMLKIAQGAPLAALDLADELAGTNVDYNGVITDCLNLMFNRRPGVVEASRSWQRCPINALLEWQLSLSRDLIRLINGVPKRYFENQDKYEALQKVRDRLNLSKVLVLYDYLIDVYGKTDAPLRPETFREQLALRWKHSL